MTIQNLKDEIKRAKLLFYYSRHHKKPGFQGKDAVFTIDGLIQHGGLSDRICGLCSTFACCKDAGIGFKVNWVYPFRLTDYLVPNHYDWIPSKDFEPFSQKPVVVSFDPDFKRQKSTANRLIQPGTNVYSNMRYMDVNSLIEFKGLFEELFKPSDALQEIVDRNIPNEPYDSVTFRFQQLLGDFKEGNFRKADSKESEYMIKTCLAALEKHHVEYGRNLLVTSDSNRFLDHLRDLPYVWTVPGQVVHMDYTEDNDWNLHAKSFVDLLAIARAQNVFLMRLPQMYRSSFPATAALIGGKPYRIINL